MRKKIAVILTALVLFSCIPALPGGSAYADSGDAAALLSVMGVISADSAAGSNLSAPLTRAELAKMLVMASPYRELASQGTGSSVFKDVPYTHWAASYIKIATANGILSGYSDGSFRPDSPVTYEQAIYGALKLLGYTREDFTGGSYPYPQIGMAVSIGLTAGVSGSAGSSLSREEGIELVYNLLNCDLEDGSASYAESIGYEVNDNGEIDYASALASNMKGPVTIRSAAWHTALGLTAAVRIYKDGVLSSLDEVDKYDVAYYSISSDTAWVYSDRVSGIYEKAEPNQDAPTGIVLSGETYEIGSTAAFSALSSAGSLKPGNSITLLLDKDGKIADAVSVAEVSARTVLYVTETGSKVYQNADGKDYTSNYIVGVMPDGTDREYAVTADWVEAGDIVSVSVDDDSLNVAAEKSGNNIQGTVDASLMQIGASRLAQNVAILDTYKGSWATVSPQRLAGLYLSAGSVLYYKAENGEITQLIMDNVSGDAPDYGVIISADSDYSGLASSGSYTYMIDGVSTAIRTTDMSYGVSKGAAMFFERYDGSVGMMNIARLKSYKASSLCADSVAYSDTVYLFADDVAVYKESGSGYLTGSVDDALAAKAAGKTLNFYYDKLPKYGGRIRVIIIRS